MQPNIFIKIVMPKKNMLYGIIYFKKYFIWQKYIFIKPTKCNITKVNKNCIRADFLRN